MMPAHARTAALGGGWSLILTDLAAILLCFFSLAVALTPPARLAAARAEGPAETPSMASALALDTALPSTRRLAEPDYVTTLLRDRFSTLAPGITLRLGPGVWLLRFDDPPPAPILDELLQAVRSLPVSLTVTVVTPELDIRQQLERRRALAQELGEVAERVLVSHGPGRALEVRLVVR